MKNNISDEHSVQFAGFWSRLMAHNIDLLFLLPAFYLEGYLMEKDGHLYIACIVTALVYEVAFISSNWNATPGKRFQKLEVVDTKFQPLSIGKALLRTLLKAATLITLFVGYAQIAFHPQKKGLHDLLGKSCVVLKPRD